MSESVHWVMPKRTCKECGKVFVIQSEEYAYKRRIYGGKDIRVWFCSYKCMRTWDRREVGDELAQAEKYAEHCGEKFRALIDEMQSDAYLLGTTQQRRNIVSRMHLWREKMEDAQMTLDRKRREAGIREQT